MHIPKYASLYQYVWHFKYVSNANDIVLLLVLNI